MNSFYIPPYRFLLTRKKIIKLCLLALALYFLIFSGQGSENVEGNVVANHANIHHILYYTTWWDDHADPQSWDLGEGSWMFENCPHQNCHLTANKQLLPHIHHYSALLFHTWKLFAKDVLIPHERSSLQKYIMFSLEPASHCAYLNPWEENALTNFFNTTFSFRKDSDIYTPYGRILGKENNPGLEVSELQEEYVNSAFYSDLKEKLSTKTGRALWLGSHCETDSAREDYIEELDKHFNITIIGACAKVLGKKSGKNDDIGQYYFYLAFENSKCKDYASEKFFRAMKEFVVPIVLGGADYSSIAPPHSYIDVRDYKSPLELSEHLQYLIDTPAEYLKYFWWKPHYKVMEDVDTSLVHVLPTTFPCSLCSYLNQGGVSQVTNLTKVWRVDAECEDRIPFHCNRDQEDWYPGREEYRRQLREEDKAYIVDLQKMVS